MFTIIFRCILFWVLFEALLFVTSSLSMLAPTDTAKWLRAISAMASALILIYAFLRFEKKSFAEIGLKADRKTLLRFGAGLLAGTVIMGIILILLLGFSELTIRRNAVSLSPWYVFGFYLLIIPFALMEELAFRSYTMIRLDKAYGLWMAQFLSAVAFAIYHILMGWTWYIAFMGPFVWAFIFGLSAIRSGGIAMPTGIHAALNICQVLFGMKAGATSFFVLELKDGVNDNAQQHLDSIGVAIHVAIFVGGVAVTWQVVKRRKRKG